MNSKSFLSLGQSFSSLNFQYIVQSVRTVTTIHRTFTLCQAMEKDILNVSSPLILNIYEVHPVRKGAHPACDYKAGERSCWVQNLWVLTPHRSLRNQINWSEEWTESELGSGERRKGCVCVCGFSGHHFCCCWRWERCRYVCLLTAKNHINRLTLARSFSETGGKEGKNG